VHQGNLHDTKTGFWTAMLACIKYPTIEKFCGDKGYRGTFVREVAEYLDLDVDISEKIKSEDWQVMPKRWVVERTFAWLNNSRRLSRDYEITCSSSETMIKISHIHTLLKRL
jgi:transposase